MYVEARVSKISNFRDEIIKRAIDGLAAVFERRASTYIDGTIKKAMQKKPRL